MARVIISPSVRGDYVVTPGQLRGERSLEFVGREPAYRSQVTQRRSEPSYRPYESQVPVDQTDVAAAPEGW